ncbi:helix-turn-helix domain-containing protein [Burkholderia pyrrocinia]|uniref:helix-turn-helix domain-containing protein n=1 Tax=Burkholderia pyrrocinia TaxID=60550 RepID=UPI002AB26AAE|nr:XRE family transcriptional regulator [Burkholderia pyrrocinia]
MTNQRYTNVWDAIEGQPAEAENMKLRSELMIALKQRIAQLELSQAQAAQRLGVTQPRISDLMRGKINLFGLDALVNMATAVGLRVDLQVRDPHDA